MKLLLVSHSLTSLLLLLLLLSTFTRRCMSVVAAKCHADDEKGLLGFKSGIAEDPSGMLQSWKPGTDCCKWIGVECRAGDRVTTLSLYGQPKKPNSFLTGTVSPALVKVQNLDGIYLIDLRNLSGSFPALLFRLPKLQFIYIENSKLSGQLPGNIGDMSKLEALSVERNRFTGTIPSSVSELTRLSQLKLGGNFLTGEIPNGIGRLKALTLLSLEWNRLTGSIPDLFSAFPELRVLELCHNNFSGKFPASIATLAPNLRFLELCHNALTGKIPDFLGNFKALDTLDLSSNRFAGTLPKTLKNLTKIFNLDLSNNFLVDPFPELYVKGIESLDLSNNQFHLGTIPNWVTSSPIIFSLKLAKCGIKMNLDRWNPAETYYYDYIDLSGNEISGSPVALLNRTDYLVGFWAAGNRLRFNMENLRIAKTLRHLDLSRNSVFGNVPQAISGLETLNVSHNELCGELPPTKFPASAFVGNDCLCGPPLGPCK